MPTAAPGPTYEGHTAEAAVAIARRARGAFDAWRRTSFAERAMRMSAAAAVLRRRCDEFARLMTAEMGKTLSEGRAEIEKCALNCDYFAENADAFLAPQAVDLGGPAAKDMKGSMKEAMGKAAGNERMAAEGAAERAAGKVQKGVGKIKEGARDVLKH